jgi:diguanylate cyclase (GGDEF)-like protein
MDTDVGAAQDETASAWFDVVEYSPVACLVVRSTSFEGTPRGAILHANEAARDLLPSVHRHNITLFDLIDDDSVEPVTNRFGHLVDVGDDTMLTVVVGLADGAHIAIGDADSHELKMRSIADGRVVAQFVPRDGSRSMMQALAEQQRFRSALLELSELAHVTEDDDEFCARLIERAVDVVPGAQGGSVQLHIPGTSRFRFVAAVGYDLAGLQQHTLDRSEFFRDTSDPDARIVRDLANDARGADIQEWLHTYGRLDEIVVNVSAPVHVAGLPVAFLSLDNFEDPDAMTRTSVEMTTVLGNLIGELWRRRELEAELRKEREAFRQQALHDPLTQLPNRRNLDRCLTDQLAACRAAGHPATVLFVDIDDFKGVNDRLGHDVGDMLLVGVAEGLNSVVRGGDVVGRWGGDEFLIVPRRFDTPEQAERLAERILQRFETDLDLNEEGLTYRARLSVGIGWTPDSEVDSSTLVSAADEALYAAKAAGKGVTRTRWIVPSADDDPVQD